jgi:hypothetical protein
LSETHESDAIKIVDADRGLIAGWGIPFRGPVKGGKDLDGEFFDKDTDFAFDWFPNEGRPVLYQHGLDSAIKLSAIGRQVSKEIDPDRGVWVTTQLNLAHRYADIILDLAKKGVLGFSSGAMHGYVRRAGSKIVQWPWVEMTLTPIPANPYALIAPEAVKHLDLIGADVPRALLESEDMLSQHEKRIADLEAALAALRPEPQVETNGHKAAEGLAELEAALAALKEGE